MELRRPSGPRAIGLQAYALRTLLPRHLLVLRIWLSTAHLLRQSRPFWASRYHDFLTTP
jgi:hypothetical protein